MLQIKKDFEEKIQDIKLMYELVICKQVAARDPILKSSIILMLYSVVESTMNNLVIFIHDELHGYVINDINIELQKNLNCIILIF